MKKTLLLLSFCIVIQAKSQPAAGAGQQTEIPFIEDDYTLIYVPREDTFPGPDILTLKAGKLYKTWQPNDHCFIKGPDKYWHSFGITHPLAEPGEPMHKGEFVSFHAVSPKQTFAGSVINNSWSDKPKVLSWRDRPGEDPNHHAPTIVKMGKVYKMIYGPIPFRMASSEDLYAWTPDGPTSINETYGRDPSLSLIGDVYYLVYCAGNGIRATTSRDLSTWTEPVMIFKPAIASYQCESPTLVERNGKFYLFWCLWDTENKNGNGYDARSFVYSSDNPLDFNNQPPVTELQAHAPEIFQDETHQWYISSVQYPSLGISVARLNWK